VQVERIEKGLWRWLAVHPEWKAGAEWEPAVGCVYWEGPDAIVLIDPQLPAEEAARESFLDVLDQDVSRVGSPVVVLTTCVWHVRSSGELAERYGGRLGNPGDAEAVTLPAGVQAIAVPVADEAVFWLEGARTLVPGDAILGDSGGGVRMCPASWLGANGTSATLRAELAPVLELPVERVLVSHGEPVLSGGLAALRLALG
jgi:glyoxylase-like metal-dependent hydrolase (beta-lactamase superfamily II)